MRLNAEEKLVPHFDLPRHQGMRKELIKSLREKGIKDEAVLNAMEQIPRHYFFPQDLDVKAYEDAAFPIAAGQTISQPFTVAFQTALLQVKPGDKILEVGTGSTYQSCVLAEMGAQVISIERQKDLYDQTLNFVFRDKYPPSKLRFIFGDGFEGYPLQAPFDKIIITCGAPFVPPKLMEQLKAGGFMVIPLGADGHQKMLRLIKNEDGTFETEEYSDFSFVPMLPGVSK